MIIIKNCFIKIFVILICLSPCITYADVYHPLIGSVLSGGRYGFTPFETDVNVYYPMTYVPGESGPGFATSDAELKYWFWTAAAALNDINAETPMTFTGREWTAYWGNDTVPDVLLSIESLGDNGKLAATTFYPRNMKHRGCTIVVNRDKTNGLSDRRAKAILIHEFGHCMGLAHHTFKSENMYCNLQCDVLFSSACEVSKRYEQAIDHLYGKRTMEDIGPILNIYNEPECF